MGSSTVLVGRGVLQYEERRCARRILTPSGSVVFRAARIVCHGGTSILIGRWTSILIPGVDIVEIKVSSTPCQFLSPPLSRG